MQKTNKHMKRCSVSLTIRVMQSKPHTNLKGNHEKTVNNKGWSGCGKKQKSPALEGNVN